MSYSNSSFAEKWSNDIEPLGYTSVPNCLMTCQRQLNITSSELNIVLQILLFKYDTRLPYPSLKRLSKHTGLSVGSVRRNLRSLESKQLIKRVYREGTSNKYDMTPLIYALEDHRPCEGVQKRLLLESRMVGKHSTKIDDKEDQVLTKLLKNTSDISLKPEEFDFARWFDDS